MRLSFFLTRSRFLVLSILLLISFSRARAFQVWLPLSPQELKMTAEPQQPGADAVILYREEVTDEGKQFRSTYIREKILTEQGKALASVKVPYDNRQFSLVDIKARTIQPDGSIINYEGKPFDEVVAKGRGIKIMQKAFVLPAVQPGSIIEYQYKLHWYDDIAYDAYWTVQDDLFQKHAKFKFIPFASGIVRNRRGEELPSVYWVTMGLRKDMAPQWIDNHQALQVEVNDIPAFVAEPFSLPEEQLKWRVSFYWARNAGAGEYWKTEGKYWSKEVDNFIGHHSAIAAEAAKVVSAGDSPQKKAEKLYARAQQIKNLTFDPAAAKQAGKSKPSKNIEDVLKLGEGNHIEINRLLAGMLRAVDIPAYMMRASTRDEKVFDANLPNWNQLSGELVIATIDGKEVFLDPGTRFSPFGLLRWRYTDTLGVRQKPDGSTELSQSPIPQYNQAGTQRLANFTMDAEGNLKGKVTLGFSGQEALWHRIEGAQTDEAGQKLMMEKELREWLPANAEIKAGASEGWTESGGFLIAHFDVVIPAAASSAGQRLLLPTQLFHVNSHQAFTRPKRMYSVLLEYPYRDVDKVRIVLPAGLQVETLPKEQNETLVSEDGKSAFGIYKTSFQQKGSIVSFERDLALAAFAFTADFYPQLKTFFQKVKTSDDQPAILHSSAAASN